MATVMSNGHSATSLTKGLRPPVQHRLDGWQNSATRPRNQVLASLPAEVWGRIAPHLNQSLLIPGKVIIHEGRPVDHVYFPNCGLLSLVMCGRSGERVEAGLSGRECMAGGFEAMGEASAISRATVQIAGTSCWMSAEAFRTELSWAGCLQEHLLRYFQWQLAQAAQYALCNRFHCVEERLARWLLRASDHVENSEIFITHEAIAQMLGTRRSGVTVALSTLEVAGIVNCGRGRITILDHAALRSHACECYDALRKHEHRLRGNV